MRDRPAAEVFPCNTHFPAIDRAPVEPSVHSTGRPLEFPPHQRQIGPFQQSIRALESAGGVGTHADEFPADRFVVEKRIKLDDAVNVRKRHTERLPHLGGNLVRQPAIDFLRGMKGGQKP